MKRVKKEPYLEFQTWEEHILKSVRSVGFDSKVNPVRKQPSVNSATELNSSAVYHKPVKIEGDWLQIEWETDGKLNHGWIKWKEKQRLIVDLYYLC